MKETQTFCKHISRKYIEILVEDKKQKVLPFIENQQVQILGDSHSSRHFILIISHLLKQLKVYLRSHMGS